MTQLSPGGLAILGFNVTGEGSDFSFVLLSGVEAGTKIYFTDVGTRDGSTTFDNTNVAEGTLLWTAPIDYAAGSVINFVTDSSSFTQPLIVGIGGINQPIELNIGGDQLIAFQGDLAGTVIQDPSFIYAVSTYRDTFQGTGDGREGDTSSVNQTGVPAGLTEGETAIALGDADANLDSVLYTGPTSGTRAELLAAVADPANWSRDAGTTQTQITADFTVTDAVSNQDPDLALPGPVTLDEDAVEAITGITVSDLEDDTVTLILTAAATLDVTASGAATVSGSGSGSVTIVGAVADVNASVASLTLTPPQDSTDAISLSVVASDKAGTFTSGTVAITVTPVDDTPQIEYLATAESATPTAEITNGDLATTPLAFATRFAVVDPDVPSDTFGDFDLIIGYGASGSDAADLLAVATTLAPVSGGTALEGISTEVNTDTGQTDIFVTENGGAPLLIGTVDLVEDGTGGNDLRISLRPDELPFPGASFEVAFATIDRVNMLLDALRFGNPAASPGTRDLTLQLSREVTPGVFETSDLDTFVVTITEGNAAPILADVADRVIFDPSVVGTTPQVVDADVTLTDVDSPGFDGGNLTIDFSEFRAGASTEGEELSFDTSGPFSILGTDLSYSGNVIGTIGSDGRDGNALSVDFTSALATPAVVEELVEALRYRNTATTPETTRQVNITVADGDGATSVAQTVAIVVETVTPPDREVTYTEDLGNVLIDDLQQFTADGADGDQTVYAGGTLAITMTGPGASDGLTFLSVESFERFLVPNGEIFITPSGNVYLRDEDDVVGFVRFGTATGNETRFLTVTFDTSETFVAPDGFGASTRRPTAEEVEQIVQALQYTNSEGDEPTEGTRTVDIVLTDATTTAEPTETFTVEVVAVEDDPVLSAIAGTFSLDYSGGGPGAPAPLNSSFDVTDPDTTNFAGGEFRVSARTTTAEDNFSIIDGNGITVAGDQVSFGGSVIGTVSGGTAGADLVVALSGVVSTAAVEALGLQVAYLNSSATPLPERDIAYSLSDGAGGESALVLQTLSITGGSALTAPVIAGLDTPVTPLASDLIAGPVVLDADVALSDADMSGFDGGSLVLQYQATRGVVTDQLSVQSGSGGVGIEVSGTTVSFDGQAFGTVEQNGVDGDSLEFAFYGPAATGVAVEALIEALQYQSTATLPTGTTEFYLQVTDADGLASDLEWISVSVLDNGIAVDDAETTPEDTDLVLSFDDLLSNDLNFGAGATIDSVQDAVGGTAEIVDETVVFSPTPDFNGLASFTYTASEDPWTSTATLSITVTPVNDPAIFGGDLSGTIIEAGGVNDALDPDDGAITGTATASDVDNTDNTFVASAFAPSDVGFGSFSVDTAGTWTYRLDQSAVQDLDAGDSVTDTFTLTSTDGTQQAVTVTITGADDAAVVSGTVTGAVTEGDPGDLATATGTLAISDVDAEDAPAFADVAPTAGDSGFGSFELTAGTWTYRLDQGAVQDLDAGDSVTDTITFTATDGTAQAVTVTITGRDDAAVVSGTVTGAVTEGDPGDLATATGTLAISDVDAEDAPAFVDVAETAGDSGFGSFELTAGTWTYRLDQGAVQDLDAGDRVTDTITFTATDGTAQAVTVTITGRDDAAVVSGTVTGAVTEGDPGDLAAATGTLAISDVDAEDTPAFADVAPTAGDSGFGSFELTAGTWTYRLDQGAVQDLDAGDSVTDTITFTATDGTAQAVTVTITGADDAAVVSGTVTGAVTEGDPGDLAAATGTLAISDVDAEDAPAFADVAPTAGDSGFGSFELTAGTWTYRLDQGAVQDLDAGDSVTDTITFTATDGTAQAVTVTITGRDDAAVVSGTVTGAVTEGDPGDLAAATGTLAISDVDAEDAPAFVDVAETAGDSGFGSFELTAGTWTYRLDQGAVQDLDAGDSVTDTITFTATDGTAQAVTVTITGRDDAAVVSGTVTGAVTEGDPGDLAAATGTLAISDVDAEDAPAFVDVAETAGDSGFGSFELTAGTWTYRLDQGAVQDLDAGDSVTDTITFTATDGTAQAVTVTITGADDAPEDEAPPAVPDLALRESLQIAGQLADLDGLRVPDLLPGDTFGIRGVALSDLSFSVTRVISDTLPSFAGADLVRAPSLAALLGGVDAADVQRAFMGETIVEITGPSGVATVTFEGRITGGASFELSSAGLVARYEGASGPTARGDDLFGTPGRDAIEGLGGKDVIRGLGDGDVLDGGAQRDVIIGGPGADVATGGTGPDLFVIDGGGSLDIRDFDPLEGDRIVLADERFLTEAGLPDLERLSLVQEASGRWRLDGSLEGGETGLLARFDLPAPAVIEGTEEGERLTGTAAAEDFLGLGGNDILISGGGDDLMRGGAGNDVFAFQRVDDGATARIVDFGAGDRLALDDGFFGLGDASISPRALTDAEAAAILDAGQVRLDLGAGRLTLDPDGPGGDGPALTIELGAIIGVGDVLLF